MRRLARLARKLHYGDFQKASIVSDDCWGGEFLKDYEVQYSSPFVGLYVEPQNYLNIIESPQSVLTRPLTFIESEKSFPVAMLGDVMINFMHYKNSDQARTKWKRRLERINWSRLFFEIDFSGPRRPFGSDDYTDKNIQLLECDRRPPSSRLCKLPRNG